MVAASPSQVAADCANASGVREVLKVAASHTIDINNAPMISPCTGSFFFFEIIEE
jgi:hypothetical protein